MQQLHLLPVSYTHLDVYKRQDFLCALLAIIILSPVILVIALLVRIKLGSPVIFKQERPGRDARVFTPVSYTHLRY